MAAESLLDQVDARTKLAGANRIEILMFSLGCGQFGREEVFGLNVFKVIEVVPVPEITGVPGMPRHIRGMVSLRGNIIPVIDLADQIGIESVGPRNVMLVTEYNRHTQGFLVHDVDNIIRLEWSQIQEPPEMLRHASGVVTAVAKLDDGRLVQLLDVEKVLAENIGVVKDGDLAMLEPFVNGQQYKVFFADDAQMARTQIARTLDVLGVKYDQAVNGMRAWEMLSSMAASAESDGVPLSSRLSAVITDIEMPEMDGYMLTKQIKSDKRFAGIPVIMHSSLSGAANAELGFSVGVDYYVSKFAPRDLTEALKKTLGLTDTPLIEQKAA